MISFHAFPSIFFFWGTAEVLQSHIENLQTLISTEITHQRLLPLNWRPDSECIWFSLSFLDYNTRLQIKPYMLQWHIILCLNVWGLFTLVPIQLNFSVLCNLCNRLKIWSHMIVKCNGFWTYHDLKISIYLIQFTQIVQVIFVI